RSSPIALVLFLFCVPAARSAEPFRFPEAKHGKGELKYIDGLPVLTVEGTPAEIGEQIGMLACKSASGLVTYLKKLLKSSGLELAVPLLVKTADSMLKQFPPDHLEELQTLIKTAKVERDLIVLGNCLWDIKKLGCSSLIVDAQRSATGAPLFGRN